MSHEVAGALWLGLQANPAVMQDEQLPAIAEVCAVTFGQDSAHVREPAAMAWSLKFLRLQTQSCAC